METASISTMTDHEPDNHRPRIRSDSVWSMSNGATHDRAGENAEFGEPFGPHPHHCAICSR